LVVESLKEIFTYTTWKQVDRKVLVKQMEQMTMDVNTADIAKHECLSTA
jgi:hypothetical protein